MASCWAQRKGALEVRRVCRVSGSCAANSLLKRKEGLTWEAGDLVEAMCKGVRLKREAENERLQREKSEANPPKQTDAEQEQSASM
jgi:hypothetical protein